MTSAKKKNKKSSKRKPNLSWIIVIGMLAIVGLIISPFINRTLKPLGEKVPVLADYTHVRVGIDPGPFNSDPPTSGQHYEEHFEAEFFDENFYEYPEGYLVHNLEHGYVIFWYNCAVLEQDECFQLKSQIRSVMEGVDMYKVIAYPWESISEPVVMTSWGRILRMNRFDTEMANEFINRYQNKAPEPLAD